MAQEKGVIEIVTMNLAEGVTAEAFEPVDKAIEEEHVCKQSGFISRQAAFSDGKWAVVVGLGKVQKRPKPPWKTSPLPQQPRSSLA